MTRAFAIHPAEQAYKRNAFFGIALLDAVTLERVSAGVRVVAEGWHGEPRVSSGGLFVWLPEEFARLRKITIDPGVLPYEPVEREPAQLLQPLTTIELSPRADYPFAAGITGLRGVLIEERVTPPETPVPVRDAIVRLRWLDDNGVWRDAPTTSSTNTRGGDFTAVLRLSHAQVPQLDSGAWTVRIRASRDGSERESDDLKLPQGRIADPSTIAQLIFTWDELHP
jgi:hypothetical protein